MKKSMVIVTLLIGGNLFAQSYGHFKKEALALYHKGEKSRAIDKTKDFIKAHPHSYKGKNLLATLYYWNKEYAKAEPLLQEVIAKNGYSESKKLLKLLHKKWHKNSQKVAKIVRKRQIATKHTLHDTKKSHSKHSQDERIAIEKSILHIEPAKSIVAKKSAKSHAKPKKRVDFLSLRKSNEKEDLKEFDRLAAMIEDDPNDRKSREILAKYYLKTGAYQRSYDMAREVLVVDPDNQDMQNIVAHLEKRADIDTSKLYETHQVVDVAEAKEALAKKFDAKQYNAYLNLYKSLKHNDVELGKKENENALFCAISLGEYQFAKTIIASAPLPHSRYKKKLQALLEVQ